MTPFYTGAYNIFAKLVRFWYHMEIVNPENEAAAGGVILCANHLSAADPVIIGAAATRQVHYMAKKELFRVPFVKTLITKLGAYPVNRGSVDLQSMKTTLCLLDEERVVGMFPQGHRYKKVNPRSTPLKSGVGMIAMRSQATLQPVYIRTKGNRIRFWHKTEIVFGEPIAYEEYCGDGSRNPEAYARVTELIFRRVCDTGGVPETDEAGGVI